jgi:hypothetical protein
VTRCISVGDTLVAVVSDGAGSASFGRQGAALTCRTISERARRYFTCSGEFPAEEEVWPWICQVRERIDRAAAARGLARREFSCTLIAVFANSLGTMVLHIGDGAAVARMDEDWSAMSWPAHGEYAAQTFFITDDPVPRLRIAAPLGPVVAVAVFSDGIERLVLDFSTLRASAGFFDAMTRPLLASPLLGRNRKLSASLQEYLDSETINRRTDDDKSLILAVRR